MCRSAHRQQSDWQERKALHTVRQEDKPHQMKQELQNRSFDAVSIKYINIDNVTSVIFSKLESGISYRTYIAYKIYSDADDNLMPFKISKSLFPKSTIEALHATKTKCPY